MITLKATEGHYLTNGDIYSEMVYLSDLDSPDNWHEVTEEEYMNQMAQQQLDNPDMFRF